MAGETTMVTRTLLLCAAMALCACNKDSSSAAPAAPVTHLKPKVALPPKAGPSAAEQTAGMVQAAAVGKSQMPVELKFDLAQRPKVGQPLQVNLALIPQVSATQASIQASGGDDVSVAPGGSPFEIPAAEAGEVYRHTLNVIPNAEGVVLLSVTVVLKHDEVVEQRVFSIPIIAER